MEASEGCKELGEGINNCRLSILNDYLGRTMMRRNTAQRLMQWVKTVDLVTKLKLCLGNNFAAHS